MRVKPIWAFWGGVLVALGLSGLWAVFQNGWRPEPAPGSTSQGMGEMNMEDMGGDGGQAPVMISAARRQLIGVKTDVVAERPLESAIRTVGTVAYDERRVRQINLRVSGWIRALFVDFTGKSVNQGDPLLILYSPDLLATQEEYLLARRTLERVEASPLEYVRRGAQAQVESARNRLLLWNLTEAQVAQLETQQKPPMETTIYSPIEGVVTKKMVLQGMYVTPEMGLYEIADLSAVWVYADIYEYEVPLIKQEQEAAVTLASYPGEKFRGRVIYIYPSLDTQTRTVKVRMEFANPDGRLKPGMYGDVEIRVKAGKRLAIPQEAVLDSGTRKLVFVDKGQGVFEPREVTLGSRVNNLYPIVSGLAPGERVVTSATFLIDSESKLMAAANMMGMTGMGGMRMEQAQMGQMEMGGMKGRTVIARTQTIDGLTVSFVTVPDPPRRGATLVRLTLRSKKGAVTDAKVTLAYSMAMPGMEAETVEAKHKAEGIYEATVALGMKGAWTVEAHVVRGKAKPLKAHFTLDVK